jgi:hypothetical protein
LPRSAASDPARYRYRIGFLGLTSTRCRREELAGEPGSVPRVVLRLRFGRVARRALEIGDVRSQVRSLRLEIGDVRDQVRSLAFEVRGVIAQRVAFGDELRA